MRIAVFGWYGHNNAGDERIKYCLNNFLLGLGGIKSVDFYDLHNNAVKGKTDKFNYYDLIIIGGGGLILSCHNYHDFILGINTKIITLGISVEVELKGNPRKFAEALLKKSMVFIVRDKSSYKKLFNLDVTKKIKVSADLTFLSPYSLVKKQGNIKIGVNLLAKSLYSMESRALSGIFYFLHKYGINWCDKTICFRKMINTLRQSFELIPIPLYCDLQDNSVPSYQKNDVNFMKKYFDSVPEYFEDTLIDDCDVFISMRLHGIIFAVQKGILFITFPIYPKQVNFVSELGLERTVINTDNLNNINKTVNYLMDKTEIYKDKMINFTENAKNKIKLDVIEALNIVRG